jgi:peptidoglycan L-alanyl-D-glutamate endopeptidase CwlK
LIENPDLAADPVTAAKLLASFLRSRHSLIQDALGKGDLKTARRLVNGGSNGLDRFTEAYNTGAALLKDA